MLAIDPKYFRPTEVDLLIGIQPRQRNLAGTTNSMNELVEDMMSPISS